MKCGGWKLTQNEEFNSIVEHLNQAESLIALSDSCFFDDSDQEKLLRALSKMKVLLNKISEYVQ